MGPNGDLGRKELLRGGLGGVIPLPPRQRGLKEENRLGQRRTFCRGGRGSWTPSSPAYKISVFISKETCAEAVGEEKRETKEIGGRGQGESLIQTRKWMLRVEA